MGESSQNKSNGNEMNTKKMWENQKSEMFK
jgi:hypothetical protein